MDGCRSDRTAQHRLLLAPTDGWVASRSTCRTSQGGSRCGVTPADVAGTPLVERGGQSAGAPHGERRRYGNVCLVARADEVGVHVRDALRDVFELVDVTDLAAPPQRVLDGELTRGIKRCWENARRRWRQHGAAGTAQQRRTARSGRVHPPGPCSAMSVLHRHRAALLHVRAALLRIRAAAAGFCCETGVPLSRRNLPTASTTLPAGAQHPDATWAAGALVATMLSLCGE
jgi:hypothetical protein